MAVTVFDESRKVNYASDAVTVTRILRVMPYAAFPSVAATLLGYVQMIGGQLTRTPPARDPFLPWCFCREVSVEGVGVYGSNPAGPPGAVLPSLNGYEQGARLTCSFKTPDVSQQDTDQGDEITLASESGDFSSQQVTLPNRSYAWAGTDPTKTLAASNTLAAKVVPRIDYTLVRHYLLALPVKAITQLLGKVNANPFAVGLRVWPAECVRFDSAAWSRKVNLQGFPFFELTYKFAINPIWDTLETGVDGYVTWNRLFRPETGQWERPKLVHGQPPIISPVTGVYRMDTDVSQTVVAGTVSGFKLLFSRAAS